jgi:hypothetical protein
MLPPWSPEDQAGSVRLLPCSVALLASERSDGITGQVLSINGSYSMV